MTIITTREQRRQLERDNAKRPARLEPVPRAEWPESMESRVGATVAVWRSRGFFVQRFSAPEPAICRLSILRTTLDPKSGRWEDNITWDEIQRLKEEAGYGSAWAVEIFPAAGEVVNVANIRHLWILPAAPAFAWQKGST